MKNIRKGLGKGMGCGYKNLAPMDAHIHSLSARGLKTRYTQKDIAKVIHKQDKYDLIHDVPERNELLRDYWNKDLDFEDKWMGGIRHFKLLPLENVKKAVSKGFLDKDSVQNESPSVKDFIEFMEKWKGYGVTAHGYAYAKERKEEDVKSFPKESMSIEGLEVHNPMVFKNKAFVNDWIKFNHGADELDSERSWWD